VRRMVRPAARGHALCSTGGMCRMRVCARTTWKASAAGPNPRPVRPARMGLNEFRLDWTSRRGKITGADGTVWVWTGRPPFDADVEKQERILNTKITYVCEAASKKTGHPPWYHAGVEQPTFEHWQEHRGYFYWPAADLAEAVEQRMRLASYRRVRQGKSTDDKDLLAVIGEAAIEAKELYDAAAMAAQLAKVAAALHTGIVHPA